MATPAQLQAAATAAIQAEAVADLALLQAFGAANGAAFTTIQTNLTTLAASMSSLQRQQEITGIANALASALASFNTAVSHATNAQTATPVA